MLIALLVQAAQSADADGTWLPQWLINCGVILGIIAFFVGLVQMPSALQMMMGKPKLSMTFDMENTKVNNMRSLTAKFTNEPITGKVKHRLGVRRETARNATCFVKIREGGTKKHVAEWQPPICQPGKEVLENCVDIHPSLFSYSVKLVVALHDEDGLHFLMNPLSSGDTKDEPIPAGRYEVEVALFVGEGFLFRRTREMVLEKTLTNSGWGQAVKDW